MEFKNKKITTTNALLIVLIAAVLFTAGVITAKTSSANAENNNAAASEQKAAARPSIGLVGPNTIADMVDKASPAVVKIDTTIEQTSDNSQDPFFNDPFFRDFFGHQFQIPNRSQVQQGIGSGFIISKDGYILTNEHVIDGATKIQVTLNNQNKPIDAQLVGKDYDLDLAILKINSSNDLPVLKLGNSDQTRVGDWVVAIGNPYGLDHTVTVGVVSAKGRPVDIEDRHYKNLLQTDASINPGNSGGPLLNLNGEVIGINTAINAQAQGIGFVIPSNTVQSVLNGLKTGQLKHPWLGVSTQAVTQQIAQYFGLSGINGAVVSSVVQGSPAEQAGLQRGDVILKFNQTTVKDQQALVDLVQKSKIGDRVELTVVRNRSNLKLTVTIGDKNSQ